MKRGEKKAASEGRMGKCVDQKEVHFVKNVVRTGGRKQILELQKFL